MVGYEGNCYIAGYHISELKVLYMMHNGQNHRPKYSCPFCNGKIDPVEFRDKYLK